MSDRQPLMTNTLFTEKIKKIPYITMLMIWEFCVVIV